MNKYVYESYKHLNDSERAGFLGKFKNSPVVIRFVKFIEQSSTPAFKTTQAIDSIYADVKGHVPYNVLENRFFKLRKKILDELKNARSSNFPLTHTEEELTYIEAKQLLASGNNERAYRMLTELEKTCWEKNIFELLPSVIDQLIFCNQSFNRLENNKEIFMRQERAIELLRDINICGMTTRKIYEINFTKGIKYAAKELSLMRAMASKYKMYPRFLMCYHHVSAYYKLGTKEYEGSTQAISRHLSSFRKLLVLHPSIPLLSYKVNYVQQQHMHFNQMMISYHFTRCEFEETYQAMKDVWQMINKEDSVLSMYKTEASYFNMVTSQTMTQRYPEALETIADFAQFLKTNHQTDKLVMANVLKARVYADVYPQAYKMDPLFLTAQVEEYIKILRKKDNTMISLDQTLVLLIKLYVIRGNYSGASKILSETPVQKYLSDIALYDLTRDLILILTENGSQKNRELSELLRKLQLIRHKASTPAEYMHIYWLQHYLKHLLR
jgi:hypothetical protein